MLGGVRIGWSDRDRATPGVTDAHGRPHPRQRRRPHRRAAVTRRVPEGPRAGEVQGAGPPRHPPRQRHRRVAHRGPGDRHLRAQRGAGPSPRELGLRPRQLRPGAPGHVRRARAHPRHERQRRARVAQLPVVARPRWPVLRAERRHRVRRGDDPRLQRLAHRRVVRRLPRSLHPARALRLRARRRVDGRRDRPRRGEGLPRGLVPLRAPPLRHRRHPRPRVGPRRGRRATTSAPSRCSTSAASRTSCPARRSR